MTVLQSEDCAGELSRNSLSRFMEVEDVDFCSFGRLYLPGMIRTLKKKMIFIVFAWTKG